MPLMVAIPRLRAFFDRYQKRLAAEGPLHDEIDRDVGHDRHELFFDRGRIRRRLQCDVPFRLLAGYKRLTGTVIDANARRQTATVDAVQMLIERGQGDVALEARLPFDGDVDFLRLA